MATTPDVSITPQQFVQWLEGGNALLYAQQYEDEATTLRAEVARKDELARKCRAVHYALMGGNDV